MAKNIKNHIVILFALTASACATQPPAPIVDGYGRQQERPKLPNQFLPEYSSQNPYVSGEDNPIVKEETKPSVGRNALTYLTQPGDTLSEIASHFRVSLQDISEANNMLPTSKLKVGEVLIIPASNGGTHKPALSAMVEKFPTPPTQQKPATVADKRNDEKTGYVFYKVKKGDNLFRIGLKHKVSPLDLMNMNNMDRPEALKAGSKIKVPLPREKTALADVKNRNAAKSQGLLWPVNGKIVKSFGQKGNGIQNTGINISAAEGTPVIAAATGSVIYASGGLKSYGNLILLRHSNGLITAYAHNKENLVSRNENIQRGQVIAYVGQSGNVASPQLHFEVRRNARAVNPIKVLPKKK